MTTLFMHQTGPLVRWDRSKKLLHVADLNPQIETKWRMSRWELLGLGVRALWAAVT